MIKPKSIFSTIDPNIFIIIKTINSIEIIDDEKILEQFKEPLFLLIFKIIEKIRGQIEKIIIIISKLNIELEYL
jgi:hypothetical protein